MSGKDVNVKWSTSSQSYFEKFAAQLEEYTKEQIPPNTASQDVQYAMKLQQKRLKEKGLKLEYTFIPRGHFGNSGTPGKNWSDDRYINHMEWRTCKLTKALSRNGKIVYNKGQNETFYATITSAKDNNAIAEELYVCPSCGAVSKVKELQTGCIYCGTYFEMKDLFPKITNFFFIKDESGTKQEINREIFKFVLPAIPLTMIGCSFSYYLQGMHIILAVATGIIAGGFLGGILGYLAWAVFKIGGLFFSAGKSMGALVNSAGSRGYFTRIMQKHSPEFSYEYFVGKVVSLLKIMLYSDDIRSLPNYVGEPIGDIFSDIIDSSLFGGVALKECQVKENYVYVTVDVYMEDLYDNNGRIHKKNEKFRMQLYRRIDTSIDYNFSIHKIQCKNCGGSFDATKQKNCPHCGTPYELANDDWIVKSVAKR